MFSFLSPTSNSSSSSSSASPSDVPKYPSESKDKEKLSDINTNSLDIPTHKKSTQIALSPSPSPSISTLTVSTPFPPSPLLSSFSSYSSSSSPSSSRHPHVSSSSSSSPSLYYNSSSSFSFRSDKDLPLLLSESREILQSERFKDILQIQNTQNPHGNYNNNDSYASPPIFISKYHDHSHSAIPSPSPSPSDWRSTGRPKTVSASLTLCLNIGVEPPDTNRKIILSESDKSKGSGREENSLEENTQEGNGTLSSHQYASKECWTDPFSLQPTLSLESIGNSLQQQYSQWNPKLKYKLCLDPTLMDIKKLCQQMRKITKGDRCLFHYNGHGVPKVTNNGELWVFNSDYTQYIPLSIYDLISWMGAPTVYVFDCHYGGKVIEGFKYFNKQKMREQEKDKEKEKQRASVTNIGDISINTNTNNRERNASSVSSTNPNPPPPPSVPLNYHDCIILSACGPTELLPTSPSYLPADLFTSCLLTPLKMSLRHFTSTATHSLAYHLFNNLEILDTLPGKINDRKTPLGELNWIFTAITDSIAWGCVPNETFNLLYRGDSMLPTLFRNFLLAQRIFHFYGLNPQSHPMIPKTANHSMWECWDSVCESFLIQFSKSLKNANGKFLPSAFFAEQLTSFDLYLDLCTEDSPPPIQLPIVLQVLLSPNYRRRALVLLAKFMGKGAWAVRQSLTVGTAPYILKLLPSSTSDLREVLVFIWSKIIIFDKLSTLDMMREQNTWPCHSFFLSHLSDTKIQDKQRVISTFILTAFLKDNGPKAQSIIMREKSAVGVFTLCLQSDSPLLRRWTCLLFAFLWKDNNRSKSYLSTMGIPALITQMIKDPITEVRTACLFAMETFMGEGEGERERERDNEDSRGDDNNPPTSTDPTDPLSSAVLRDEKERHLEELKLAKIFCQLFHDGSPLVRQQLLLSLAKMIEGQQNEFWEIAEGISTVSASSHSASLHPHLHPPLSTPNISRSLISAPPSLHRAISDTNTSAPITVISQLLHPMTSTSTSTSISTSMSQIHSHSTTQLSSMSQGSGAKPPSPSVSNRSSMVRTGSLFTRTSQQQTSSASISVPSHSSFIPSSPSSSSSSSSSSLPSPLHSLRISVWKVVKSLCYDPFPSVYLTALTLKQQVKDRQVGKKLGEMTVTNTLMMSPKPEQAIIEGLATLGLMDLSGIDSITVTQPNNIGNNGNTNTNTQVAHISSSSSTTIPLPLALPVVSTPIPTTPLRTAMDLKDIEIPQNGRQRSVMISSNGNVNANANSLIPSNRSSIIGPEPFLLPPSSQRTESSSHHQTSSSSSTTYSLCPYPFPSTLPPSSIYERSCDFFASPTTSPFSDPCDSLVSLVTKEWRSARNLELRMSASSFNLEYYESNRMGQYDQTAIIHSGFERVERTLFHPYENMLIATDSKRIIGVFDYFRQEKIAQFSNDNASGTKISSLHWVNENQNSMLMVGSNDGVVKIWRNPHHPTPMATHSQMPFTHFPDMVTAFIAVPGMDTVKKTNQEMFVDWNSHSARLICSGLQEPIRVWDVEREICVVDDLSIDSDPFPSATSLSSTLDGNIIYVGYSDNWVRMFDLRVDPKVQTQNTRIVYHSDRVLHVKLQRGGACEGKLISCGYTNSGAKENVFITDIRRFQVDPSGSTSKFHSFESGKDYSLDCFSSHDFCPVWAGGSRKQIVRVGDHNGNTVSQLKYHKGLNFMMLNRIGSVNHLSFHPYKLMLAVAGNESQISILTPTFNQ